MLKPIPRGFWHRRKLIQNLSTGHIVQWIKCNCSRVMKDFVICEMLLWT